MAFYESMFGGGDYSTSEVETGKYWIDMKPVYRKVVNLGALPNGAVKDVAHDISNLDTIVSVSCCAYAPSADTFMPIPFVTVDSTAAQVRVTISKTAINIQTGTNRNAFSTAHAILEYTKTTD